MPLARFTVSRGKHQIKDVALSAGAAEAQTDTASFNVDYPANRSKGDVLIMLEAIKQRIIASRWPPQ